MHITLGVDGHKESHTVVAINQVGQFLDQITISNDPAGFQGAYRWAYDLGPDRTWGIEIVAILPGHSPNISCRKEKRSLKSALT